jgi:acyl carrier protein
MVNMAAPLTPAEAAVAREIVRIAREELRLEGEPPAPDAPLAEALDSLALLGLVVAVEDRFHVILADDDAASARSLADLARLVVARAPVERLPAPAEAAPPPQPRSAGRGKSGDEPPPQPRSAGRGTSGDPP